MVVRLNFVLVKPDRCPHIYFVTYYYSFCYIIRLLMLSSSPKRSFWTFHPRKRTADQMAYGFSNRLSAWERIGRAGTDVKETPFKWSGTLKHKTPVRPTRRDEAEFIGFAFQPFNESHLSDMTKGDLAIQRP